LLFERIGNYLTEAIKRRDHVKGKLFLPISKVFVFKNGKKDLATAERFKTLLGVGKRLKDMLSSCCHLEIQRAYNEWELGFSKLTSFDTNFVQELARKEASSENSKKRQREAPPAPQVPALPPALAPPAPPASPPPTPPVVPTVDFINPPPEGTTRKKRTTTKRKTRTKPFDQLSSKQKRNNSIEARDLLAKKFGYSEVNELIEEMLPLKKRRILARAIEQPPQKIRE
jgi:hypothetical protein